MRRAHGLLLATAGVSGCSADAPVLPELPRQRVAEAIVVVAGDSQRAYRGTPLSEPVTVAVLDRLGRPVARTPVQFRPASPTATVFPAGFTMTDSLGQVTVVWYLGDEPTPQRLLAVAADGPAVEVTATAFDSLHATVSTAHTGRIHMDDPEPPATFTYMPNVLQIERDFISNNAPHQATVAALWSGDSVWVAVRTLSGPFPAYSIGRYTALIELPMRPRPRHIELRSTIHALPGSALTAPLYFELP
jgi:hypothetical protein